MRLYWLDRKLLQSLRWWLGVLLLWETIAWSIRHIIHVTQPETKWPYLSSVVYYIFSNMGLLLEQGGITFINAISGFVIGSLLGLGLAILMSLSETFEKIVIPYIVSSQMVPIIGLAPIVFGILHDANLSRVIMAAYVTFFPVTINCLAGLTSIKKEHKELIRSYASPRTKYYLKLALPASLPYFFLGMKLAAPLSITASIVVELMGAPNGIGVAMVSSLYYGSAQSDMFWATVLFSSLIGLFAYWLISKLERIITPWQPEFRNRRGENT